MVKSKFLKKKVIYKPILKKAPRASYVIESAPRSSSFQKEWSKENMLAWK